MSEFAAISAIVHGRVQGVYFRAYVEDYARSLKLTGYVRNLQDRKSVQVCAEGDKESLQQLLAALNSGPPRAKVERVDVNWSAYSGRFNHFEVRYF